jgi:hypothetical protein
MMQFIDAIHSEVLLSMKTLHCSLEMHTHLSARYLLACFACQPPQPLLKEWTYFRRMGLQRDHAQLKCQTHCSSRFLSTLCLLAVQRVEYCYNKNRSVCLSVCTHKTRNCEETERRTKKVLEIKVVEYDDSYSEVPSVVTSDDL